MRGVLVLVALVVLGACGGDEEDDVVLSFASPSPGAAFVRDQLGSTGALVALVPVTVEVSGSPARVGLTVGDVVQPDLDAAGFGIAEVRTGTTATLTATAYDAADAPLATASVDITLGDPTPATCKDWLDLYQVVYTDGPAREGVADPVTAEVPVNGVFYRSVGAANRRTTLFGDCSLVLSLARAASFMRERRIVEVTDYGIYNYRCIGGGTPPDCPNGISQHAYATAIDLAGFTDVDDTYYSVNDDWVIDPESEETCEAASEPGKDAFLHELICALKGAAIWNIVLTPNYNAAHRNHFHVDLSPDSDFIERGAQPHHH